MRRSVLKPNTSMVTQDQETFDSLKRLLLKDDHEQIEDLHKKLDRLQSRVEDRAQRSKDVSEVLSAATELSRERDEELGIALRPILVEEFRGAARNEPEVMAEALFPVLGPAIRKMIASLLSLDTKRPGQPYRVDQLFLIDRQSGLPIQHTFSEDATAQDADMVSGMLSAIQSFVNQAFSAPDYDGLESMQVGELSIWIEWGPDAALAVVIRGVAPTRLRTAMRRKLESIHRRFRTDLKDYSGDAQPFNSLRPELAEFLESQSAKPKDSVELRNKQRQVVTAIVALTVAGLTWLTVSWVNANRWGQYVQELRKTPGVVVVAQERGIHGYKIDGLKDPLATHPDILLSQFGFAPDDVESTWRPYQSLEPSFVLKRANRRLRPPTTITLELSGYSLAVSGHAPAIWLDKLRHNDPNIAGVRKVLIYALSSGAGSR